MPTISTRTAKDLLAFLDDGPGFISSERSIAAIESLRLALKPRPSPRRKAKTSKQRANTSAVYEVVRERAGGRCECGCGRPFGFIWSGPILDHFFGRAKAEETVENCWMLRFDCNHEKTTTENAREWQEKFGRHAQRHGYLEAVERVKRNLEGRIANREAEARR